MFHLAWVKLSQSVFNQRNALKMKHLIPKIALSLLAFGISANTASGASLNLVANGSFEDGFNGWTHGGTFTPVPGIATTQAATIFYNSNAPYPISAFGESVPTPNDATNSPDGPGLMGAYFVDDGARNESLSQFVFLTPGAYRIGFDVYAPNNGYANQYDARFSAQIAGMTLANYMVSSEPAAKWVNFSGVASIATAGLYSVSFLFNSPGLGVAKDLVVDRVFIVSAVPAAIPEPSTLLLIGGVLLLMAAFERSRKRPPAPVRVRTGLRVPLGRSAQ